MYDYKFCWRCNKWKIFSDFNIQKDKFNCIQCYKLINDDFKMIKKKNYSRLIDDRIFLKTLHLE